MDQRTREVREDIERTRVALTQKIETLNTHIHGSIEEAKTRVKQSFNPRYQMQQHPWPMMGISVLVGYTLERFISKRLASSRRTRRLQTDEGKVFVLDSSFFPAREDYFEQLREASAPSHLMAPDAVTRRLEYGHGESIRPRQASHSDPAQKRSEAGPRADTGAKSTRGVTENAIEQVKDYGRNVLNEANNQIARELDVIKGAALGVVTGLVRDMVKQVAPAAGSYAKQVLDTASIKLTGRPLPTFSEDAPEKADARTEKGATAPLEQRPESPTHVQRNALYP